jgi:hypothetical protein
MEPSIKLKIPDIIFFSFFFLGLIKAISMPNYLRPAILLNCLFILDFKSLYVMYVFVERGKKMPIGIFYRFS